MALSALVTKARLKLVTKARLKSYVNVLNMHGFNPSKVSKIRSLKARFLLILFVRPSAGITCSYKCRIFIGDGPNKLYSWIRFELKT